MTYTDLEKRLTELLQQPDSALAMVKPLLDDIKADYETMTSLVEANGAQEKRIRDLQDTNIKLFLAQTGKPENLEEEDEDVEGAEAIDAFVAKISKEE